MRFCLLKAFTFPWTATGDQTYLDPSNKVPYTIHSPLLDRINVEKNHPTLKVSVTMKRIEWYEIGKDILPLCSFNFVIVANNISKWWLEYWACGQMRKEQLHDLGQSIKITCSVSRSKPFYISSKTQVNVRVGVVSKCILAKIDILKGSVVVMLVR